MINHDGAIHIKQSNIDFETTTITAETLPNPAELLLGSLSACMLKNVQRFSDMMKFSYSKAVVDMSATRLENPPRMDYIEYDLTIHSSDKKLNLNLLKKNIENFGTIYNTIKSTCSISGTIKTIKNV